MRWMEGYDGERTSESKQEKRFLGKKQKKIT